MADKKAKKAPARTHWTREQDAKKAALAKGLKEGEFELVYGPKGHSYRKVKGYVKVEGARLHGTEPETDPTGSPEELQQENPESMRTTDATFSDRNGKGNGTTIDEEHAGSGTIPDAPSGEGTAPSIEEIKQALKDTFPPVGEGTGSYGWTERLSKQDLWKGDRFVTPAKQVLNQLLTSAPNDGIEEHPAVPYRTQCPSCKQQIETFGMEGARFFIEHDGGMRAIIGSAVYCEGSEESIPAVTTTTANDFAPHERAQIQMAAEDSAHEADKAASENHRGEQIRPLTDRLKKSIIAGPSKTVWDIADKMKLNHPELGKKDVLAECMRLGIAFNTARTQYQLWRNAHKSDPAKS